MSKLVAEIVDIFSSIQGEGLFVGARQIFVRFKRCNIDCMYCDEDKNRSARMLTPESLIREIAAEEDAAMRQHSVSLTGGEPLLYDDFLASFLPLLKQSGRKSYLETNGTLPEKLARVIGFVDIIAMDIKLPSATGCGEFWDKHKEFLRIACKNKVFVKAVVTDSTTVEDIIKASEIISEVDSKVPFILQPATTQDKVARGVSTDKLLGFLEAGNKSRIENIRVIPQVHKVLKLK